MGRFDIVIEDGTDALGGLLHGLETLAGDRVLGCDSHPQRCRDYEHRGERTGETATEPEPGGDRSRRHRLEGYAQLSDMPSPRVLVDLDAGGRSEPLHRVSSVH